MHCNIESVKDTVFRLVARVKKQAKTKATGAGIVQSLSNYTLDKLRSIPGGGKGFSL
jgi:hypothetical protein